MKYYYEPVNLKQWNMFEKVKSVGHIEPFLATKSMEIGDLVLLHVGAQLKCCPSGIYAVGEIIAGPYILHDSPEDYCNEKLTVDVKIRNITRNIPYIDHEKCKEFITQFRTVHVISAKYYASIQELLPR